MSNVSDLYDLWLKAHHLPTDKAINVTIEKVERRIVHPRPTEEKPVLTLSFVGKNRRLILNDGNANKMSDIGGEDYSGWPGLVISLKRQKYTKDKETIIIGPALPGVAKVEKPMQVPDTPPESSGDNGKVESPAPPVLPVKVEKPYRFPSTASQRFYDEVQAATKDFYRDGKHLEETLGGWFNFGSEELWQERLSYACDMARQPVAA